MRAFSISAFLLFGIISISNSQQKQLVIYGNAEVTEAANRAEFTFVIEKDGNSLKNAFAESQMYLNSIFMELRRIGLDSNSIQQSRVRVNERDLTWFTSKKYKAVLRTKLVVDNLSLLENVLEILGNYEIEYLSEIQFSLKDYQLLNQRAYNEALYDAKKNALALSKAQGFTLGEVHSIVEESERTIQQSNGNYRMGVYAYESFSKKGAYAFSSTVMPEQILFNKQLKVTFIIN